MRLILDLTEDFEEQIKDIETFEEEFDTDEDNVKIVVEGKHIAKLVKEAVEKFIKSLQTFTYQSYLDLENTLEQRIECKVEVINNYEDYIDSKYAGIYAGGYKYKDVSYYDSEAILYIANISYDEGDLMFEIDCKLV